MAFCQGLLTALKRKKPAFSTTKVKKCTAHTGYKGADTGQIDVAHTVRCCGPPQGVIKKVLMVCDSKPVFTGERRDAKKKAHDTQ
ncbi:hypothetical protein AA0313_2615 [Acetobacter indonesiensis NRIC 0313]|nr:hypothetical protein AA0313_2615 [Acetobacter indonesiensis NRIC 0313]